MITPHREALEALFGIVKMRDSWTMDVHARVSILNHERPGDGPLENCKIRP